MSYQSHDKQQRQVAAWDAVLDALQRIVLSERGSRAFESALKNGREVAFDPLEIAAREAIEESSPSHVGTSDSEARRLAILECAQMVNGRLAGRQEGSDLWLEIIKITNMLARHAGSEWRSTPSATALSDTTRLDWLQSQLAKGWGDGFAMHSLDGGALYPRPWKKELESMRGMEPDLKTGAFLWQADIRTAIDEAIRRADGGAKNV